MSALLTTLYDALPTLLQDVTTAAYGVRLRQQRYGGRFREARSELARTERAPAAELRALQDHRLAEAVTRAARTRYYRDCFRALGITPDTVRGVDGLPRLPTIDKATVLAQGDNLRAPVPGSRVRMFHTSGTTGTTLAVPIDAASRQRNYAFFARALAWAGVEGGRSATFAGRTIVPATRAQPVRVSRWNPAMHNRLFSSYHLSPANAERYARELCAFRPDYIDAYPSAVAALARLLLEAGLPRPQPHAIITSSETLSESQRACIEEAFGARCYDQYGCTEQSAFISQCEHGSYHVHPDYGIVELLRPDGGPAAPGEVGELVCTTFTNHAFPLLRYRLGDEAVAEGVGCPCGRAFPVLRALLGRVDDVLITPDGRRVGRLDPVFKGLRTIREAQIVQESTRRVRVRVVPGPGYGPEDAESIQRELAARLGPEMTIRVDCEAAIERTSAGKLRAVVNLARAGSGREGSDD